jgi:hypothetical protein
MKQYLSKLFATVLLTGLIGILVAPDSAAVKPKLTWPGFGELVNSGYLAVKGQHMFNPALVVDHQGNGVMSVNLAGSQYYPSAALARLQSDPNGKPELEEMLLVGEGKGPLDEFAAYDYAYARPRWGDYAAATSDGKRFWLATEYISQTCSFQAFLDDPTCGGTRSPSANWATRVTPVEP